jgi:hypothetical protein
MSFRSELPTIEDLGLAESVIEAVKAAFPTGAIHTVW